MTALSSYLQRNFGYTTGPFENIDQVTPAKPWIIKGDYNLNNANKITFRYNQLTSSTDKNQSGSSSLGTSRPVLTTQFLTFANSNYKMIENIKSGVGEWNSVFRTLTNSLIIGNTVFDEPRGPISLFPFVVIGDGAGSAITSFGSEPFTPYNLLNYKTFQIQDSATKFTQEPRVHVRGNRREVPLGQLLLLRHSELVFVQHPERLLHRREQLPGQPEPRGLASQPEHLPGQVPAAARPDDASTAIARRRCTRAAISRTSGGRGET